MNTYKLRAQTIINIEKERMRQEEKHPKDVGGFPAGSRMEILTEEVGEVAKALLERDKENLKEELIQVAAVAIRWYEAITEPEREYAQVNQNSAEE